MPTPCSSINARTAAKSAGIEMSSPTLEIIYQDAHWVAINKPTGLLVHPSLIDKRETKSAMHSLRDQLGCWVYPLHRLDKATSGVLLFALSADAARCSSACLQQAGTQKTYLAVVRGYTEEQGLIDYPLREQWDKLSDRQARRDNEPKAAVTAYRRLAQIELPYRVDRYPSSRYSLLEVMPKNGRKHQIRRHMKHIAHPIIGDTTHGKSRHNRLFQQQFGCARLLLHASRLRVRQPISGQICDIEAGLDTTFSHLIEQLGWQLALRGDREKCRPLAACASGAPTQDAGQ
jgi:tRNA pseudouridine65 synthase